MKFEWNRQLGLPEAPYARRWVLPLPRGYSIRLHNWMHDDDPEATHDHPTWFVTFVLRGGYEDRREIESPLGNMFLCEEMQPGMIRFRPAEHRHNVIRVKPNTWTLCLFGRDKKRWSFYKDGKAIRRDKFFAEVGHHLPDGGRVRLKPDGSRI